MPVDRVAAQRMALERANTEGSLSNEAEFRKSLEAFQQRYREYKPSVIDISTDAEKQFRLDLENLIALAALTDDREIARLSLAVVRALQFLVHRVNQNEAKDSK